ncbi:MAG: DEAD/DEAH box helicase family protein [Gemmatales bacterium]|nr:DEAD/DEAH box helicase [Gemmatales bacterium]MDW7995340.1 DEAD/DEAH box helicase family protein [Gemmatales bacterium]
MILRDYQQAAVAAVYDHLRTRDDNPCVVIPTADGKTPVMARICKDAATRWDGRVLVLAPVKELLEQTADKLTRVCPEVRFGIYLAGLKRRDRRAPVIVASIQSVYQRACEFEPFDLVLVDEAHLIPPDGDGMYRQFPAEARIVNPNLRVIGFTATPFRLKTGSICTPEGFLNHICYEVGVRELIVPGYLCPLVTKAGVAKADFSHLHVRAGEFVADKVEALMDDDRLVETACREVVDATGDRKAVLIFASGIKRGQHIVRVLGDQHGLECGLVPGDLPIREWDGILEHFRSGDLKYLANVNVLTTGFDAPHIDSVVPLRPTLSAGLYYQMVGRGFRLHPGKANCLVLDFGGNVLRHGPVDQVKVRERPAGEGGQAPAKECPECRALIAAGHAHCPECGYEFPPPERSKHDAKASEAGILSGQVTTTYVVREVFYSVHRKHGAPQSMRVDYRVGWHLVKSEWACFEHTGYVRAKVFEWWRRRSHERVPETAEEAVTLAKSGRLAGIRSITVRSVSGEDCDRIIGYELGEIPPPVDESDLPEEAFDLPFGANLVAAEEVPW